MQGQSHKDNWNAYATAWAEADSTKRMQILERYLAGDVTYTDSLTDLAGYAQFSECMAGFQKDMPGVRFVTTGFTHHHQRSLAQWNMVDSKGSILGQGESFVQYGQDGRLTQITGFFESPNGS